LNSILNNKSAITAVDRLLKIFTGHQDFKWNNAKRLRGKQKYKIAR